MKKILHMKASEIPGEIKKGKEGYEYNKRKFVSREEGGSCVVSVYEIPPNKSAYPYHYHTQDEEVFYIISGKGTLKTPEGEREVSAGDILYFPANKNGAHKLTNLSDSELLVYIDFDTCGDVDVALYPDSGKIGIWGMDINKSFKLKESVDYYEGE